MAHEWDSYYNNLPPLSCDPSTVKTSADEDISQQLDSFTGPQKISDSMASLESPATNKSFDTNFYSNPETGNPNSDCVFEERSWQADESLAKGFLPNCGNSVLPAEFPSDSLSSPESFATCYSADLQGLKDDCGMLNSFLDNYSDISSCSDADVNEMIPPCKLLAGTSVHKSKTNVSMKQTSSEWIFNHTGSLEFPTDLPCPNVAETNLRLQDSSVMKVDRELEECAQDQTGNPECIPSTSTCNMLNEEDRNGRGDCKEADVPKSVEQCLSQSLDLDIIDDKGSIEDGAVKTQDDNKQHVNALNVMRTCDEMKNDCHQSGLKNEMAGLILEIDRAPKDQDPKDLKTEKTQDGKCDTLLVERKDELDSSESPSKTDITNALNDVNETELEQMQTKEVKSSENEPYKKQKPLNSNSSHDQDKGKAPENGDILKEESSEDSVTFDKPFSNHILEKTIVKEDEGKNKTLSEEIRELNSTKNFKNQHRPNTNSKNTIQAIVKEKHGKSKNLQEELKEDEKSEIKKSFDPISVGQAEIVKKEEEDNNKVIGCCEKDNSQPPESLCETQNLPKKQKSDDCDKQDPIEPCLELLSSCSDTNLCPEEDGTSPVEDTNTNSIPDGQQSQNQRPQEPKSPCAGMSLEEADKSTQEPLVVMDCEPVSGEESLSAEDTTKRVSSQHTDINNPRKQTSLSCAQVQKHLQPVVILKSLEPSIKISNSYQCTGCQYTTHCVDNLIEHHHNYHFLHNIKYCDTCNVYMINHEQAEKHLCAATKNSPQLSSSSLGQQKKKKYRSHRCDECGLQFPLYYQYVGHMRTHTGITPYRCNGCGTYFSQTGALRRHKIIPGRCKPSDFKSGTNHRQLQQKRRGPASKESSQANRAGAITENESQLQKDPIPGEPSEKLPECYVKLTDISKTHCCKFCGGCFLTAKKARKHIRHLHRRDGMSPVHEDENNSQLKVVTQKFKCPLCPRQFKYSYNRTRHLHMCVRKCMLDGKDRVNGKYPCPFCSYNFSFASNRQRHVNQVCLKEYLEKARKAQTSLIEEKYAKRKQKSQSEETEEPAQSKERHRKKRVRYSNGPGLFKCHLCPAIFRYHSGKHRHLKKHEMFKLTGKLFRYRNSAPAITSEPPTSSSADSADKNADLLKTDEEDKSLIFNCHFCDKSFSALSTKKKHELIHQGDKPYRCLECGRGFKKRCYLIGHKIIHQRRIQCTDCKLILSSVRELIQHRKTHIKRGMLQCPDCDQQFQYPVYLLRHLESHRKKEIRLSHEKTQEKTKVKPRPLLKESLPDRVEEQLQCSLCKEMYAGPTELRQHFLTHVSGLQCPFCQQDFTDRRYLVRHMIVHTGFSPYSCPKCGKRFFREIYCKLHRVHCMPGTPAPIPTKGKSHKRTVYHCQYCPRVFTKKCHQEKHHYGHKTNTLFLCTHCGQSFGLNKFNSHKKKCMNGEVKPQQQPSQTDPEKGPAPTAKEPPSKALAAGVKKVPFDCPHCEQTFRFQSLLMRHLVTHTGLQPYVCAHCGDRFRSRTKCSEHEASCDQKVEESKVEPESQKPSVNVPKAEGDRQYKCRFCTRTFMKARSLRRHILTHNEVNPYRCKSCDSCFSRYDHLKVHQAHCKRERTRLEVCIPKISLDDVGKGWQSRYSLETSKKQETFDCQSCSKSFSAQSVLARHKSMFHMSGSFKCGGCGSSFSHKSSLTKHMKKKRTCAKMSKVKALGLPLHAKPEPTKSVAKPLSVVRDRILQRIQPHFDKNSKYFCSYCPRVFPNPYQLRVHTYLHTGERPYSCDYCGEKFIRRDYLHRHLLKCTKKEEKKVPCDTCNGFFTSTNLETHKMTCVPQAPSTSPQPTPGSPPKGFFCAYCSSRFLLFSQLQEHYVNAHKLEATSPPVVAAPLQHHLSKMMKIKEEPLEDSCNKPLGVTPNLSSTPDKKKDIDPLSCPECNMTFINKAGLSGHLRVHKDVPFHCRICNKGFWNKNFLYLHQRKCRSENNSEGNTDWQLDVPLKAHIDFALTDSSTLFKDDSESSGSGQNLSGLEGPEEKKSQSNTDTEKKAVQYQCSECEKTFTDGLMLISHLEDHGREEQEKKRNTCFKCGRVFASLANLEKHKKMHNGMKLENISCPDCPRTFCTSSDLEEHKRCHDQNRSFACKLCHLRFRTKITLCEHFSEEHPEAAFHCHVCNKAYSLKKSLYRHYNQCHKSDKKGSEATAEEMSPEEPPSSVVSAADGESDNCESDNADSDPDSADYFPCHVCGKTFPTSESLEDHQLCHLGKKPHECEECGKCFYQASQLQQHQRKHKSEFQCKLCGRGFVSLFSLRKHKHTHGKKRPLRCSKCHLSFKGPLHLAEHMAIHREEIFPCDMCSEIFPTKSSRAEHRKSHSKSHERRSPLSKEENQASAEGSDAVPREFKYRCGVCSERFKDPEELSEHGCLESKGRLYSCFKCDKHFLHASHLKKHNNSSHRASQARSKYQCNRCNMSFSSENFLSHLESHVSKVADELKVERKEGILSADFKCPVCSQCFSTATELICHFPTHSSETSLDSSVPKTNPPTVDQDHQDDHLISAAKYECSECGQSFLGTDAFRQHSCSHQHPKQALSPPAKKSPNTSHQATPGEEEEVDVTGEDHYHCPVCSEQFSSKSLLLDHQNKHHSQGKTFKCKICGKAFSLRCYLRRHERRHEKAGVKSTNTPADKFRCTQCGSEFSNSNELSVHKRFHAEKVVGKHRCDMCYKSFSRLSLLWQHQESHVGQIVYECNECDKAFAFPHLLEEHQLSHMSSEAV